MVVNNEFVFDFDFGFFVFDVSVEDSLNFVAFAAMN